MHQDIIIRPLETIADLQAMQEVEQVVWDSEPPTPTALALTIAKNGGVLLGAFLGEQMIGMLLSFPGFQNNQAYLCSHSMGVLRDQRHGGIGEKLKQAQAELALTKGYQLMTWTYDPLLTPNGYLNIGKLGVVCSTYIEDCYGEMTDQMNKGLPSDRFQVEWWLNRERKSLPQGRETKLIHWQLNNQGLPQPCKAAKSISDEQVISVAVPADFQGIKQKDMELAKEWRLLTRQLFSSNFAAGWVVAGFRLNRGEPVHEYLLVPRTALSLPQAPWQKGE